MKAALRNTTEKIDFKNLQHFKESGEYVSILADFLVELEEIVRGSEYDVNIYEKGEKLWKDLCTLVEDEDIKDAYSNYIETEKTFREIWGGKN